MGRLGSKLCTHSHYNLLICSEFRKKLNMAILPRYILIEFLKLLMVILTALLMIFITIFFFGKNPLVFRRASPSFFSRAIFLIKTA